MNSIQEIGEQILSRDEFMIVGHAIPDGDCIGSLLGLYLGLMSLGKQVQMVLEDPVPPIYMYLAGVNDIMEPEKFAQSLYNVIYLDCSDKYRVGKRVKKLLTGSSFIINIDHHPTNDFFGHYNYVDPNAGATAEIIYKLLKSIKVEITPDIADALYAGIIKDTGSFLNNNTTSKTMKIAADLLDSGADVNKARINLIESKPREEVLLLREALKHIDFSEDGKIAWMMLSYQEAYDIGALDIHPEGIINYTRMIEGVEVALLFREISPGYVKVGFRSRGRIDVSALAVSLGGGGHRQAAGAEQKGSLKEVKEKVLRIVREVV
jgi:phosphoesterase RecJ-like protein